MKIIKKTIWLYCIIVLTYYHSNSLFGKISLINREEKKLFEAILTIENVEECRQFFHDLCTPSELQEFSSRWLVARLLNTDKSYREIANETGVSTTTIGRVARFIKYGNNGYKTILERTKINNN